MEEREINLRDMIFRIFMRWRVILIWMLVFAVLLDVFGVIQEKMQEPQERYSEEELDELKETLTDQEILEAEHAVYLYMNYEKRYDELKNYLDHSIKMRLNANGVPTLLLRYRVDTHYSVVYPDIARRDVTGDVINSLGLEIQKDSVYQKLAENWREPVDGAYLKEMVSYSTSGELFTIQICALTEEDCKVIEQVLDKTLSAVKSSVESVFGEFDLHLINRNYYEEKNTGIFNEQNAQINNLNGLLNSMRSVKSNLDSEQIDYYEALLIESHAKAAENDPNYRAVSQNTKKKNHSFIRPKWILIGLVAGGFLACLWFCVVYILGEKLHVSDEIERYYGIPLVGTVGERNAKTVIDRVILSIFKGNERYFSYIESLNLITAKVKAMTGKTNIQHLFISDNVMNEASRKLIDELMKLLEGEVQTVEAGSAAIYDSDSVVHMAGCDAVIMLLGVDITRYEEIQKEAELCQRNGVRLLGGIVMN